MNSVEFTTDFQKMEIEYGLFDLQTVDGIFFWDMIRHDIF